MRKINLHSNCSHHVSILAFSWTAGLFIGVFIPFEFPEYVSLMRMAFVCPVSIVGLAVVLILPLSITGFAFSFKTVIIYFSAFLKALAHGASISTSVMIFGAGAWLAHFLFLFSDLFLNFAVLCSLLSNPLKQRNRIQKDFLILLLCAIMFGFVDFQFVSPFLVSVLLR